MFTGIIEEKGTVERITRGECSCRLTIGINKIAVDIKPGDSIAVNGVCLTAAELGAGSFTADVMAETVRRTSLSRLEPGSRVNLERAMPVGGRFGGHIVSGHVDGTGTMTRMTREDNAIWVRIAADEKILRYIVEKGSVALDGISLTVAEVGRTEFAVSIIPHTAAETTLAERNVGDIINIECDIIGKYVEKLCMPQPGGMTEELLKQYGF